MPKFQGTLRVTYNIFPPYVLSYVDEATGKTNLYGYMAWLFTNITASLNMTYEASKATDGEYGFVQPDGTFTGGYMMLETNQSDIGLGPFIPEEIPFNHFYLFPSIHFTQLAILTGMKVPFETKVANFLLTFDSYVWIGLLSTLFFLGCLFNAYDKVRHKPYPMKSVFTHFFVLLESLLLESTTVHIKSSFSRFLWGLWLLICFVLMQSFAGLLKANTSVRSPTDRVNSVDDLISNENLLIYFVPRMVIESELMSVRGERGRRIKEAMKRRRRPLPTYEIFKEPVRQEVVNRRAAILLDLGSIQTNIANWCVTTPDYYYVAPEYISHLHGAWYARPGLDPELKEAIKMRILWTNAMKVEYVLEYLMFPGHFDCVTTNQRQTTETADTLMMSDLSVVFMTLEGPLAFASLVCFGELVVHRLSRWQCSSY